MTTKTTASDTAATKKVYKTVVGYVSEVFGDRRTLKSNLEFKFALAVYLGRKKVDGVWVSDKTYFTVAAYNRLAEGLMRTFARHPKDGVGLRLMVSGELRKDRKTIAANIAGPDLTFHVAAVVPFEADAAFEALLAADDDVPTLV